MTKNTLHILNLNLLSPSSQNYQDISAISITFSLLKRKSNQKGKNILSGDIEYITCFNLNLLSPSLLNCQLVAKKWRISTGQSLVGGFERKRAEAGVIYKEQSSEKNHEVTVKLFPDVCMGINRAVKFTALFNF